MRQRFVTGLDVQQTETVPSEATGESSTDFEGHRLLLAEPDSPRVEENRCVTGHTGGPGAAEVEESPILEKEFALFWEEQTEARQIDLLLVCLNLRKIRVVRKSPPSGSA